MKPETVVLDLKQRTEKGPISSAALHEKIDELLGGQGATSALIVLIRDANAEELAQARALSGRPGDNGVMAPSYIAVSPHDAQDMIGLLFEHTLPDLARIHQKGCPDHPRGVMVSNKEHEC